MTTKTRWGVGALLVLNAVVLLGQLWPEGAPPFARAVNIGTAILTLAFLVAMLSGGKPPPDRGS